MRKRMTLGGLWRVRVEVNHLCLDTYLELAGRALGALSARARRGLGTARCNEREGFARFGLRDRRRTFAAQVSWQAQPDSWQVQHFRTVGYRFRGRRSTFAGLGTDFVATAPHFAR